MLSNSAPSFLAFRRFFPTRIELETKLKDLTKEEDRCVHLNKEYEEIIQWLNEAQKAFPSDDNLALLKKVEDRKIENIEVLHKTNEEIAQIKSSLKQFVE